MAAIGVAVLLLLLLLFPACDGEDTPIPSLDGSSRSVSFLTSDGVELQGRLFGEGEIGVVLAHMYPADQTSWWYLAQHLGDNGYAALTFNFRGYGEGADRSGGSKEFEVIDRDVEAALEFLLDQGVSASFLLGASMGGTASLKVAAQRDVAGVVSLSAPVEFRGISVEGEQAKGPVLLMSSRGDSSARNNLETMMASGTAGQNPENVVFEEGNDHGTNIFNGVNKEAAKQRIMEFLKAHRP